MQRIRSVHALSLFTLALALGAAAACDAGPDPADDAAPVATPASDVVPALSDAEIAAVQAERRVATLTPTRAGRLELINVGDADEPSIAYVQVGGRQLGQILHQLVDEQEATPAEVFLALADEGEELPELLLRDHEARVAAEARDEVEPRALAVVLPRTLEEEHHGCLGSGASAMPLSSWVSDWIGRFRFINSSAGNEFNTQNTADGGTSYYVSADSNGRVLSACNAAQNDPTISYWLLTNIPGPYYPFTLLWAQSIDSFDAVHLYEKSSAALMRMGVSHSHPSPKTYVATGRCNGGC